jgi:23S rRNA-/tRNA-specific pseudouridylate synthase
LHAEAFGHPVAGDSKYGRRLARGLARRAPRLSLHAERLGFDDLGGRRLTFEVPFPDDLNAYWAELRDAPPPQGW